ncbi:MAG: dephospho-CoA kinase [Clostridia bacterium]|nr:dephospho-CoA kinase [Clostridia bacterium]
MIIIGITGPTGCGKTTLLRDIARRGGFCIGCDALYYSMLRSNEALRSDLCGAFGNVFLPDGSLNRRALGSIVFQNEETLSCRIKHKREFLQLRHVIHILLFFLGILGTLLFVNILAESVT